MKGLKTEKGKTFTRKTSNLTNECQITNTSKKVLFAALKNGKMILVRGKAKESAIMIKPGETWTVTTL